MTQLPSARQQQIIHWLRESRSLTMDELVTRLGVSLMTVHRDLDQLVLEGQVEKVRGGVLLARPKTLSAVSTEACALCNGSLQERTAFVIHPQQGDPLPSCCPHCGFLLLHDLEHVTSILARDFLYGRVINARQATYLLESDIYLCCLPSVLCFASSEDAARFQRGFRGQIVSFAEAHHFLLQRHSDARSR